MYNYWKCRVFKRSNAVVKYWGVATIETDLMVTKCVTWEKAIKKAIRFQEIQNRGWRINVNDTTSQLNIIRTPTRIPSGYVKALGHDPSTNTMHIEFNDGDVYEYEGVSAQTVLDLKNSFSPGKHFHNLIKPIFVAKKVK